MTEYVIFEEPKPNHAEFSCQTDEIAIGEVETQTVEESISEYNHENDDDDPEVSYWEAIVTNRKNEVQRMKRINEKMEDEKTEKKTILEAKQNEYKRLFDLGNETLNGSKEEDEDEGNDNDDREKTS
uniref:Clathrin light chain n=1 Tax=Caenorhabditis tropicalis TaxID=1561998 RepID=A0A1I7U3R0_9PELO